MARVIHPNLDIVRELPSLKHIRNTSTVLLLATKTLAALRYAKAHKIKQFHTDETSRRQETLLNFVVGIEEDGILRSICMSCSIIAQDGTAEEQSRAIMAIFPRV